MKVRDLTEDEIRELLESGIERGDTFDEAIRPLFMLDAASAGLVLDGAATPHNRTER